MAIKQVRAQINGTWHTLTYDSSSGSYKATITAPGSTSFNQSGGYYNVTIEATNDAGTVGTASGTTVNGLRLVVREKVAPVITILSPSSGAYVTNNKQPVTFTVVDEVGGSGVNLSLLAVKLDGVDVAVSTLTNTPISNGYSVTYTPASSLADGKHTIQIQCADNDGNVATAKSTTYTVDTIPPILNISAPAEGLVTNTASLTVRGTTNDAHSSPVTVRIINNSNNLVTADVAADGTFSKTITLITGVNVIEIQAEDAAGKRSSVIRNVTLDTSVPKIASATITPNPVDAGATMVISVVIE